MDTSNVPDLSRMSHDEKDALIIGLLQQIREIEARTEAKVEQLTAPEPPRDRK